MLEPNVMNRPSRTQDTIQQLRIRFSRIILSILIFLCIALMMLIFAEPNGIGSSISPLIPIGFISVSSLLLVGIASSPYKQVFIHLTALLVLGLNFMPFSTSDVVLFVTLFFSLVTAALVTESYIFYLINAVAFVRVVAFALMLGINEVGIISVALLFIPPFTMGFLIRIFEQVLRTAAADARRSAEFLEASANVGQIVMSKMSDTEDLIERAVDLIRDRFGFYHVQIFLVDEQRQYAYLQASTGEAGKKLLARQHRLPIDARSVIGRVAQVGEPVILRDTKQESGHVFNELLPNTRSELAVPITEGAQIIGALDVQSTRVGAFNTTSIQALQVMANQLAVAIRNARLFEEQLQSVRENKRLFVESETALREIQRLNRRLTQQAWQDYLGQQSHINGVTLTGTDFRPGADWTPTMQQATQRRRAITVIEDDAQKHIAVPIELRGEVIGAIEIGVSQETSENVTADMLQAVAQRLAISIDNARLFEETQETTAQEQSVGEIVARYQSADTIDELLEVTLRGLTETLGAEQGTIRIGQIDDEMGADA